MGIFDWLFKKKKEETASKPIDPTPPKSEPAKADQSSAPKAAPAAPKPAAKPKPAPKPAGPGVETTVGEYIVAQNKVKSNPHFNEWGVRKADSKKVIKYFSKEKEALKHAEALSQQ
jgi:hypothetical protein